MNVRSTMLVQEGRFAARVAYEETYDESPFGPTVRKEDAEKLDRVRLALRRGDIAAAKREAEVFELTPVA